MPTRRHRRAPSKGALTQHEKIIRALIDADPRMYRNGFWQEVEAIMKGADLDSDDIPIRHFRPDAYMIDRTNFEINIVEVEVTHAMPARKLREYVWWWFCWESAGETEYMPRLFVVDRYGHYGEIDLEQGYDRLMLEDAGLAA